MRIQCINIICIFHRHSPPDCNSRIGTLYMCNHNIAIGSYTVLSIRELPFALHQLKLINIEWESVDTSGSKIFGRSLAEFVNIAVGLDCIVDITLALSPVNWQYLSPTLAAWR